jgi:hypothetical protein
MTCDESTVLRLRRARRLGYLPATAMNPQATGSGLYDDTRVSSEYDYACVDGVPHDFPPFADRKPRGPWR